MMLMRNNFNTNGLARPLNIDEDQWAIIWPSPASYAWTTGFTRSPRWLGYSA